MDELKAWINAKDYTVAIMETMVKGGAGQPFNGSRYGGFNHTRMRYKGEVLHQ